MFVFVLYAALVWYAAIRWRRSWLGLLCVLAGLAGVALIAFAHIKLNQWTHGRIYLPVLQVLLYPYGALILMIGLFILTIPRIYAGSQCRKCGYELKGLETHVRRCPECGTVHAMFHETGNACATCAGELGASDGDTRVCEECKTVHLLGPASLRETPPERRAA